jgi:hypothetical protein
MIEKNFADLVEELRGFRRAVAWCERQVREGHVIRFPDLNLVTTVPHTMQILEVLGMAESGLKAAVWEEEAAKESKDGVDLFDAVYGLLEGGADIREVMALTGARRALVVKLKKQLEVQ